MLNASASELFWLVTSGRAIPVILHNSITMVGRMQQV
jgi:hypothetical protein